MRVYLGHIFSFVKIKNVFLMSFILSLCLAVVFTNCSQFATFSAMDLSSLETPLQHPDLESQESLNVEDHPRLVGRDYVTALFLEIFKSSRFIVPNLEGLIEKWSTYKGAQWGGACNIYDSYSVRDCQSEPDNVKQPILPSDSVIRQAYAFQLCDNMLGSDVGVQALLEKIGVSTEIPSAIKIQDLWFLFYRRSIDLEAQDLLNKFDLDMQAAGATWMERWRGLALLVCESPGWQVY